MIRSLYSDYLLWKAKRWLKKMEGFQVKVRKTHTDLVEQEAHLTELLSKEKEQTRAKRTYSGLRTHVRGHRKYVEAMEGIMTDRMTEVRIDIASAEGLKAARKALQR